MVFYFSSQNTGNKSFKRYEFNCRTDTDSLLRLTSWMKAMWSFPRFWKWWLRHLRVAAWGLLKWIVWIRAVRRERALHCERVRSLPVQEWCLCREHRFLGNIGPIYRWLTEEDWNYYTRFLKHHHIYKGSVDSFKRELGDTAIPTHYEGYDT